MKKKILIIGNDNGLPGVKVDINNYQGFFKSPYGGCWQNFEIEVKLNPTKKDLIADLLNIKKLNFDYLIVIFSGHGGQERETVLEINKSGECINASDLRNLALRQLNIYDCCRSYSEPNLNEVRNYNAMALAKALSTDKIRERYERRILQATYQQVDLYACSIGETASDTSEGGLYSKYFLQSSKISGYNDDFKLVSTAHQEASEIIAMYKKANGGKPQTPEMIAPRCLSSQQLIIGINPDK